MIINNKLDKSFGPTGTSAGIFLFVVGFVIIYFSFFGLILVLIGAFVGFTSTSTLVDFDKKRFRFSNNLFGFIPTGQWIYIKPGMKIGIHKSNKVWRSYSRSNRALDIPDNDYRLILYDSNGKELMPIKKFKKPDSAKSELEKMCKQFGLSPI